MFYFRKVAKQQQLSVVPAAAPVVAVAGDVGSKNLLWVDDKPQGEHHELVRLWSRRRPDVSFRTFSSLAELSVWIQTRSAAIDATGRDVAVRIVTNRYAAAAAAQPAT